MAKVVFFALVFVLVALNVAIGAQVEAENDVPETVEIEFESERELNNPYVTDPPDQVPNDDEAEEEDEEEVIDYKHLYLALRSTSGLAKFRILVNRAGLAPTLRTISPDQTSNQYTVFAPTDNALDNFPTMCLQRLYNRDNLEEFVKFHIGEKALSRKSMLGTSGRFDSMMSTKIKFDGATRESENVVMLLSKDMETGDSDGRISFVQKGNSNTNINTNNGFLHGIEPAMIPPSLMMTHVEYATSSSYALFFAMVKAAGVMHMATECNDYGRAALIPPSSAWADFAKSIGVSTSTSTMPETLKEYYKDTDHFKNLIMHHFTKRPITKEIFEKKALEGKGIGIESGKGYGGVRPVMDGSKLKLSHGFRFGEQAELNYKATVAIGLVYEVKAVLVPSKIARYNNLRNANNE